MIQETRGNRHFVRARRLLAPLLLGAGLVWGYWPTLVEMARKWSGDPRYSHGFLVPAFALFLLRDRRGLLASGPLKGNWWGVSILAVAAAVRIFGAYFYVSWYDSVSILPALAGLSVLFGGWRALRWSAPAIGFLIFMIPLPYRVELALGGPLQHIATLASNYALQALGLPAVAEGNVIFLGDSKIGVVEACNGLGMLFMFFATSFAVALVIRRPAIDKVVIVLSAVPIALAANVTRITVTGLLHELAGGKVADAVYHDLAGWLMMPLAVGAVWLEFWLLSRLFVEGEASGPASIAFSNVMIPLRTHNAPR